MIISPEVVKLIIDTMVMNNDQTSKRGPVQLPISISVGTIAQQLRDAGLDFKLETIVSSENCFSSKQNRA
ncbi:hypothetical protein [Maridesulfovibrio bastinii]|uniref:hypothetical protein n=1 Tax=Maridesulfovibrio bastinii TaxID=47157 RepID=UPI0003FE5B9B|nr:hypothetical protein [Maridesulfovibrio bastinii]